MLVVTNVDDLGLHPAVRRAVDKLAACGVVTSSTLLANGPDLSESVLLQDKHEGLGLGAHLNLLRGKPISNPDHISSLVDDDGLLFGNYSSLLLRYVTGRIRLSEVEKEWSAQIEYLLDHKVRLTHFDSEKHIHAWPGLFTLAGRLAKRYGVKWIRKPFEHTPLTRLDKGMMRTRFLQLCLAGSFPDKTPRTASCVWGIGDQKDNFDPVLFEKYIDIYQPEIIEIVCHPGDPATNDGPLPSEFGPMRVEKQWKEEFNSLSSKGWLETFEKIGAVPVNYGQINPLTGEIL
ncbi:ChbG/HpnK family deacetylase [Maridesulfovibrio hydrothermalis]|uniref:YdjC family protein n=1 Tax=Maridesulfovibrio hydrothermalis AM13 = DSM 14728 TaxID=1121451 RepID=L0RBR5_9BACT|nr:ChbG/HpnK family deacetylase [Maridesulfovibrio hydrothermalis]CCO22986.1 YdjC family protein [Maridesulfovibrio hydrothermalis AM13 = DSM 14728]